MAIVAGLSAVRPYFRARFATLGYKEWDDGFNFENIPENIIDKAYHIDDFTIQANSFNQTDLDLETLVTTRIFLKGYRSPKDALDNANERLEAILREVLKPSNRLTGTQGLRNVLLTNIAKEPIALSNDNTLLITIEWSVQVNMCIP